VPSSKGRTVDLTEIPKGSAMIVAFVSFKVSEDVNLDQARAIFKEIAGAYLDTPGLIRKYFLISDEHVGAGVYLWENRDAAEKLYNGPVWAPRIRELYGVDPDIKWFHCPVIAETMQGQIKLDTDDTPPLTAS
jgi:hypothetical protein